MRFQCEIELPDEIQGSRCAPLRVWISYCSLWGCRCIAPPWYSGSRCAPWCGYRLRCSPWWYALWWQLMMIFRVAAHWQTFQVAAWWMESGILSSPLVTNSSSSRFKNDQHTSKNNQEINTNKQVIDWDVHWWFMMMSYLRWSWHDDYMTEMIRGDTWWHLKILEWHIDWWTNIGRWNFPSWEGVLIFAIAVKFHLG